VLGGIFIFKCGKMLLFKNTYKSTGPSSVLKNEKMIKSERLRYEWVRLPKHNFTLNVFRSLF
jgi:hypothetical protein